MKPEVRNIHSKALSVGRKVLKPGETIEVWRLGKIDLNHPGWVGKLEYVMPDPLVEPIPEPVVEPTPEPVVEPTQEPEPPKKPKSKPKSKPRSRAKAKTEPAEVEAE
jgi:outer membrane biosynthesis protein TonB